MGAADAPGRLSFNSIIVGFGIFFNPALGPGASIGVSVQKEGSRFRNCPCGWLFGFGCVLLNKWEWFILTLFCMLTLNLQILLQ